MDHKWLQPLKVSSSNIKAILSSHSDGKQETDTIKIYHECALNYLLFRNLCIKRFFHGALFEVMWVVKDFVVRTAHDKVAPIPKLANRWGTNFSLLYPYSFSFCGINTSKVDEATLNNSQLCNLTQKRTGFLLKIISTMMINRSPHFFLSTRGP